MEEDFLKLSKKCTIEELHEENEEGFFFMVSSTITDVLQEGPWWYSGCSYGKFVRPRSGAYYCDTCGSHFTQVIPRYRVTTACVPDETSQGIFVLFDREAVHLWGKSCDALFKEVQMDADLISGDNNPLIFKDLVERRIILKVDDLKDEADKYFGNYRVRRLYDDDKLIKLFDDESANEDGLVTPAESQICGLDDFNSQVEVARSNDSVVLADAVSELEELSREMKVLLDSPLIESEAALCEVLEAGESSGQNLKAPTIVAKRPVKRSLIVEFDSEEDDDFVPAYKAHKARDE
ncbi:hypothetical protein PIB30_013135 [Stylosanthes scabra]|uniref:Replication factor A C-terminal domain-containing protein n=1 Tax=Stylosanthes scabra TaxID=79078 RepID=A0ABU6X476_9FABA|nr:hypothetical protein [Stylosanthes scabra]